jgi:hypothetical protein
MILIGSSAIKHWFPDFHREPKDIDYISPTGERTHGTEYLHNPILDSLECDILPPDLLYTLKMSHLCWNINWEKHMFDLQFLKKKGCKLNEDYFWKLYNYWPEIHGKNKRSDLKMTKDEFFSNSVNYDTMEHDQVHLLLNPVPIYTKILMDGKEVELDPIKWQNLSIEDKLDLVREEVMVMAHERYKNMDYRRGYDLMLKKFIISHCPIFSLIFTIENYVELLKPKFNFYKIIENGRIK